MSEVQYTEKGMPFLVPEVKLEVGEAYFVAVEGIDGYEPNFCILGHRDKDGSPVFLPCFENVVDENGNPNELAQSMGIKSFSGKWSLPEELRWEIFSSLDVVPPVLAVDRVMNDRGSDDIGKYPQSFDRMPTQMVGVVAPPQTGKTTILTSMAMASAGERQKESSVRLVDMDDFSPESLTATVDWLMEQGYDKGTNLIELHDAIIARFTELQKTGVPRQVNQERTLKSRLKSLRERYRSEEMTHLERDGELHKLSWLVDLPGTKRASDRPADAFDWLRLAMPCVEVFKAGENLNTWELLLNFAYINKQIDPIMRDFEYMIADMEVSLVGMTRAELDQLVMGKMITTERKLVDAE